MTDADAMARALELAASARGRVEPNPMVGAVLLSAAGDVIAEGYHRQYGGPHAEAEALQRSGEAARGATLVVTLEPCAHHGKQPPCAEAVVRAGVTRVVCAMGDPFEEVAGRGFARLREAGIVVDVGTLEAEARRLNAPFLKRVATGRPYVLCKWAMTLDGKTAAASGHSRWITGEAARADVHALRGRMDAVVAGSRTVAADDARLSARPPGPRVARAVILDSPLKPLTEGLKLVQTAREERPLLAHGRDADPDYLDRLRDWGFETLLCDEGSADARPSVGRLLDELGRRGMTNVLVEGGAGVHAAFFAAGECDELHAYVAPKVVGPGLPAFSGPSAGLDAIPDEANAGEIDVALLGADVRMTTRVPKPWR